MAITKLMKINTSKGTGSNYTHLKNSISYICDGKKIENGLWIGGNAGTTADGILNCMIMNKETWGKTDQRQGYHYVLSFSPEEHITADLCHQIAQEFTQQLLNDRFYYVTAVHNDKKHMHVHLIFDSVSKEDGLKFHSPKGDWEKRIQPITDRLCQKYHLSTLQYEEHGDRKGNNYQEWKKQNMDRQQRLSMSDQEPYTAYDIIRDDIDEALQGCRDYADLINRLQSMHYDITRDQKYLSLKPDWRKRAVRTGRLGVGYSKEALIQRIENQDFMQGIDESYRRYGEMQEVRNAVRMKVKKVKDWKMPDFQKQYYRRLFRVYHIRHPYFRNHAYKYKQDILQVKKLSRCMTAMIRDDISSLEDVAVKKQEIEKEVQAIQLQMKVLQTKMYKDERYRLLQQFEKLEEDVLILEPEKIKIQKELYQKMLAAGGIDQIKDKRDQTKMEMKKLRTVSKNLKKEIRILTDIEALYYQPLHQEYQQYNINKIDMQKNPKTERR